MRALTDLRRLLFPASCLLCGERLSRGEEGVCLRCAARLPRTRYHLRRDNPMEQDLGGRFPLERAAAFLRYAREGDAQLLVRELKYRGRRELGVAMGRMMAAELLPSGFLGGIDGIVPVPLHRRRERRRGYNQSERLAAGLSERTGIPVWADALRRTRHTETQTRKTPGARWANVDGAFACPDPGRLDGRHALLLDDVLTTGATVTACADALSAVPRLRLSVLTMALAAY